MSAELAWKGRRVIVPIAAAVTSNSRLVEVMALYLAQSLPSIKAPVDRPMGRLSTRMPRAVSNL